MMPDVPLFLPSDAKPPRRPRQVRSACGPGQDATVSKVITGREIDRISEETRQRVLDAVRELNYVPQSAVREMQTGRTGRIGVLLLHPAAFGAMDPYHSAILGGILSSAYSHRRNTLLYTALEPVAETLRREILGGGADAVIAVGKVWSPLVESVVMQANLPVVYVSVVPRTNTVLRSVPYFAVDCDNESGGRIAIEHLAELGHRRIGLVVGNSETQAESFVQERITGATQAAQQYGVDLAVLQMASLENALSLLGSGAPDPLTALFLIEGEGNLYEIIADLAPRYGLSVPQSLSLVAFNSTRSSELAPVPVTAVRQPLAQIGAKAVDVLVDYIDNGPTPANRTGAVIRLPVTLDIRASTAPPVR